MTRGIGVALLLLAGFRGCVVYEYEHEFWLRVDGSGSVNVTGRPALWKAFKELALPRSADADPDAARAAVRELFERSGLRVRRVTLTHRRGRAYLFVAADFDDVNDLARTPAFPDLQIRLSREGDRLHLSGTWSRPPDAPVPGERERDGLMAVRFHLPSKVYAHRNAFDGVERGNIVSWRQEVADASKGGALEFGATLDQRSILLSTVTLFAASVLGGLGLLGLALYLAFRRGRRESRGEAGEA